MHAGAIDGAAEQLLEGNYPVAIVEQQAGEYLVGQVPQAAGKKAAGSGRVVEAVEAEEVRCTCGRLCHRPPQHTLVKGVEIRPPPKQ